ncbi:hypothetical protein LCGC14_1215290 [marine sediment metagenome]|uniref:Uncharacterized protein n=1 Tax=marine sediment metagenome TaxID=412755 RepID=A0A0F9PHG7_9ZZZZ
MNTPARGEAAVPNKYYEHKIHVSHLYNIYESTKDLYKCMIIVEKSEDKASLKAMIQRKENHETSI